MGIGPLYEMTLIGNNLRRLRKKRGISVRQVREYLNLETEQAVYKYEQGKSMPPAEKLLALMKLFEASVADLTYVRA